MLMDSGHVFENPYLACTSVGLGGCAIAAVDGTVADQAFSYGSEEETIFYSMPVGAISEQDQEEENNFYAFVKEQSLHQIAKKKRTSDLRFSLRFLCSFRVILEVCPDGIFLIRLARLAAINVCIAVCKCCSHAVTSGKSAAAAVIARQHRADVFHTVVNFDSELGRCNAENQTADCAENQHEQ